MKKIQFVLSILWVLLLFSCIGDRTTPILITNLTGDTVLVEFKENNSFNTDKEQNSISTDGFSVYKLAPEEVISIGFAINEIDNDIPFSAMRVICKGDTLLKNQGNAKALFDKTVFGDFKLPYNIAIKKD